MLAYLKMCCGKLKYGNIFPIDYNWSEALRVCSRPAFATDQI